MNKKESHITLKMEDRKGKKGKGKKERGRKEEKRHNRAKKVSGKRTPRSSGTLRTLKSFVFCLTTLHQEKIDGR